MLMDRLVHDLKQPLNLIRVTAQQVRLDVKRERLDVSTLARDMADIEQAVDELVRHIDRLRRLLAPADEEAPPAASLERACATAVDRLLAERSGARIEQAVSGSLPAVVAVPERLEQALWELLDNAVLAVAACGRDGRVRVSAHHDGDQVTVTIDDDGCGVPDALHERIFDPFFTTRAGAMGIGLPLAVALVDAGGGRIVLAHSKESGSCFHLALRAAAPTSD